MKRTRRGVLKGAGGMAVALLSWPASATLPQPFSPGYICRGGGDPDPDPYSGDLYKVQATSGELRVRHSASTPQGRQALATFGRAVSALHSLSRRDRRHWRHQARIHRQFCPHGNWFFLPWHRAMLHFLEDICRTVTGETEFALPYWDWTEVRSIPGDLWGRRNPLDPRRWNDPDPLIGNSARRVLTPGEEVTDETVNEDIMSLIMQEEDFEGFASYRASTQRPRTDEGGMAELEATPHNSVHMEIGGHMADYYAPLDPIFWLHHANVDRIWAEWNALGNQNTDEPSWRNYSFYRNFVDGRGRSVRRISVSQLEDTRQLGYVYDTTRPEATAAARTKPRKKPFASRVLASRSTRVAANVVLGAPVALKVAAPAGALAKALSVASDSRQTRIFTRIVATKPPRRAEGFRVRVFVNHPALTAETPTSDPHYVTSFSFFATGHAATEGHPIASMVDITKTLHRLVARKAKGAARSGSEMNLNDLIGELGEGGGTVGETLEGAGAKRGDIVLQLVSVPFKGRTPPDSDFSVGKVELLVVNR